MLHLCHAPAYFDLGLLILVYNTRLQVLGQPRSVLKRQKASVCFSSELKHPLQQSAAALSCRAAWELLTGFYWKVDLLVAIGLSNGPLPVVAFKPSTTGTIRERSHTLSYLMTSTGTVILCVWAAELQNGSLSVVRLHSRNLVNQSQLSYELCSIAAVGMQLLVHSSRYSAIALVPFIHMSENLKNKYAIFFWAQK